MNIQQERQKSPGQTPKQAQVNQQEKLTTKEHVHPVSARVSENKKTLEEMFGNSADIKMREMVLGFIILLPIIWRLILKLRRDRWLLNIRWSGGC